MTGTADDDDLDLRLARARERVARKAAVESRLSTLRDQIAARRAELEVLDERLRGEEADVRTLEGMGLTALFETLLGRRQVDEIRGETARLDEERRAVVADA
jgi:hypothetical protein